jgi:hypothetical protein
MALLASPSGKQLRAIFLALKGNPLWVVQGEMAPLQDGSSQDGHPQDGHPQRWPRGQRTVKYSICKNEKPATSSLTGLVSANRITAAAVVTG